MDAVIRYVAMGSAMLLSLMFVTRAVAQEAPAAPERPDITKLREQANPGPEHDELEKYSGKWQVKVTMGNGDRIAESSGRVTSYMTLERRFLWIGYNVAGKAGRFKGSFTLGFDRRNERYSLIAMDTYGTYFVTSHGKKDTKTGRIKLYGKDDDPHMKAMGFDKEFLYEIDFRQPDEFDIVVYFIDTRTPEREEIKAMQFKLTRTK